MYSTIQLEIDKDVATVALNRPEVVNAFNAEMISELTDAFSQLASRADVRVVVLRAIGGAFCAGADVAWMQASLDFSREENIADAQRMSDMFAAIDSLPKPVLGRVRGLALGGGMGLVAVCDIVIADYEALFGFTEVKLGIIPAVISRFVVPKIGPSWARALYLTGERFSASLAREIGLVHYAVASDRLDSAVAEKLAELRSSGPEAMKEAKALIRGVGERASDELREYTSERIAAIRTGQEGQKGLRAFLEKRKPDWAD